MSPCGELNHLGCDSISAHVGEVFCRDRFTRRCQEFGLHPGYALDLSTGWDMNDKEHVEEANRLQDEVRPWLLIGSPECKAFCLLMRGWNRDKMDPDKHCALRQEGLAHLLLCIKMYLKQLEHHHFFLHEHPDPADSWQQEEMQLLILRSCGSVWTSAMPG